MTSPLSSPAVDALEDAHVYPMYSSEYRAAVQRAYHLFKRVAMSAGEATEREVARGTSDGLVAYLAVPWERMETVEVRYADGTTEVVRPTRDGGALDKMRRASAMRIIEAQAESEGASSHAGRHDHLS